MLFKQSRLNEHRTSQSATVFKRLLMTFVQTLSDEAILNFLANDTPMENYAVNEAWDKSSGLRGYLEGKSKRPYIENSVRMGVARVQVEYQREMRNATKAMKNGTRHPAFWGETMKHLLKDSHRIGYLAAIGGHSGYSRDHQMTFSKNVSTRFLWMNKFIQKINERGLLPEDITASGMFAHGAMAVYNAVKFPDIPLAFKQNTVDAFRRTMWEATKKLYSNRSVFQFESVMLELIEQQYGRAWREGMRTLELDPAKDMTPDAEAILQDAILAEYDNVGKFAQDVVTASRVVSDKDWHSKFSHRVDVWANRYNQIKEMSIRHFSEGKQKLMWVEGDSYEKCSTCLRLDGIVAYAEEWDALNVHPQSAPNPYLICGGWNCRCTLVPTDKRRSPHAFDSIMNIVVK
jgi:hypothetical protein